MALASVTPTPTPSSSAGGRLMVALTLVLALALQLLGSPASGAFWSLSKRDPGLRAEYDTINEYLVKNVPSEDAYDNLMEIYDTLERVYGYSFDSQLSAPDQKDSKFKQALIQFASLTKLVYPDTDHCDLVGQELLARNVLASGAPIMVPDNELGPLRRIDQVIRQVAKEHADDCRREYPKRFRAVRESKVMEEPLYVYIRRMIDAVIATSSRRVFTTIGRALDERTILKQKALGIADMSEPRQAEAILFFVRAKGADDPQIKYLSRRSDPRQRNKWLVDETRARKLLDVYVFDKCRSLDQSLGHILKPATFEQQLYSEGFKYRAVNEHVGELMVWIEYYRLCQRIANEDREAIVRNILKFIWRVG